jgi:hypothetical protein
MSFTTLPTELQTQILECALPEGLCRNDTELSGGIPHIIHFDSQALRIVVACPSSIAIVVKICENIRTTRRGLWSSRLHGGSSECTTDDRIRCWRCIKCMESFEFIAWNVLEGYPEKTCNSLTMIISQIEAFGARLKNRQESMGMP